MTVPAPVQDDAPARTDHPSTSPALPPPEQRGRLQVDQSVVRKVAEHAANQVPGTVRASRRIAGVGLGERGASVRVSGSGSEVELSIDLALRYPSSVREIVADLRGQVSTAVTTSTGYRVRTVDVTVSALLPELVPRIQ